ncbi:MAG: hypothetical protein V4732_22855 [Pseudomonadota bacterium]
MHRIIFILIAILFYAAAAAAEPQQKFDYQKIVEVAAVKDDTYCVFAHPDIIRQFKNIVANSVNRFEPAPVILPPKIFDLFLIAVDGTSTTVILGDHWLSDGTGISQLTNHDFTTIMAIIKVRSFENDVSTLDDLTSDFNLAEYRANMASESSENTRSGPNSENIKIGAEVFKSPLSKTEAVNDGAVKPAHEASSAMHSFSSSNSKRIVQQTSFNPITLKSNVDVKPLAARAVAETEGDAPDVSRDEEINKSVTVISIIWIAALLGFLWRRRR